MILSMPKHYPLRCYKCLRENFKFYMRGILDKRNWNHVVVVGKKPTGHSVICKCEKCGYVYHSDSVAAFRELEVKYGKQLDMFKTVEVRQSIAA